MHLNTSRIALRVAVLFLAFAGVSRAEDGWAHLKVGMTTAETAAVLGNAILTSHARGFAVQIYDGRAEVVFVRGRVASWTAPADSGVKSPALATWPQYVQPAHANTASVPATRRAEQPRRGPTLPAYRL